jgi:type IV pilus assembly protein PilM
MPVDRKSASAAGAQDNNGFKYSDIRRDKKGGSDVMPFLRRNPLGIEITDTHIKLCELNSKSKKSLSVKHAASVELAPGTMNDGRIQNEGQLVQAFRKVLDVYDWSTRHVHFAIPSQSVMVRFLKMPNVSHKALAKLVDFEIKNNMHLPFEDPFYDFVKLETKDTPESKKQPSAAVFQAQWEAAAARESTRSNAFSNDNAEPLSSNTCDVMLTAASKELLQQYIGIFKEMDLKLASIEIKSFSLNRLQQRCLQLPAEDLILLADVNGTNCDLTIVRKGVIQITRNVSVSLLEQPMQQIDTLDRMFADFTSQKGNYEGSFNELAGELERLINFYRYTLNNREAEFRHLIVTGDIPMLDEFMQYLNGRLNMNVSQLDWNGLRISVSMNEWNLSNYAVPLGLCLRGIN